MRRLEWTGITQTFMKERRKFVDESFSRRIQFRLMGLQLRRVTPILLAAFQSPPAKPLPLSERATFFRAVGAYQSSRISSAEVVSIIWVKAPPCELHKKLRIVWKYSIGGLPLAPTRSWGVTNELLPDNCLGSEVRHARRKVASIWTELRRPANSDPCRIYLQKFGQSFAL